MGWGLAGSGGGTQLPEAIGSLRASPPEAGGRERGPSAVDFCNFLIKIIHFIHISVKIDILKQ